MLTKEARTESTRTGSQPGGTIAVGGVEALDSSREPGGDALAGVLNGEIVAVITIRDGVVGGESVPSDRGGGRPAQESPGDAPGGGVRSRW